MNNITYAVSVDVNNPIIPYNVYVANVLDSNVRYLEITLYQNGNVITLSNTATATASLVTDDVLVDDSVECTISNNIITVPLEDLQRHGNLDVQVTVTEGEKVLAIPFPIQVRVTPNIAEEAQIDENSMGSYAEVVQEIAEARNGHNSLDERLNSDVSGMETVMHKVQSINSQSQTFDNDKYPSVTAVRNYVNTKTDDLQDYIENELDELDEAKADKTDTNAQFERLIAALQNKANKAETLAGYGINDAYTKAEVDALNSAKVDKADYTEVVQEIAEEVGELKSDLTNMTTATALDVGKALKAKNVSGGKVTEWEFGEAGSNAGSALYGKRVSILGDSISTYANYLTPSTNTPYYPYCQGSPHADITSVDETWWKIVIDKSGMILGANNSFSGRTLIQSATTENIIALATNGTPDIILVYLGTNDANQQVTLGQINKSVPFNVNTTETYGETLGTNLTQEQVDALLTTDFYTAVRTLIVRLQWYYPNAKIVFLTLGWGSYERFFADNPYRQALIESCELLGVDTIDIRKAGIHMPKFTNYTLQRVHPNKAGMQLIGEYVFNKLVSLFGALDETRADALISLSYSGTLLQTSYEDGDTFNPTGLTFTAVYNDGTSETINAENIIFSPNPLTFGTTVVTASYTKDGITQTVSIDGIAVVSPETITTSANIKFNVISSISDLTFKANGSINGVANLPKHARYEINNGRAAPYINVDGYSPEINGEVLAVNGGATIVFSIPTGLFTALQWTLFELNRDAGIIANAKYAGSWMDGNYTLTSETRYILLAFKVNNGSETPTSEQLAALNSAISIQ